MTCGDRPAVLEIPKDARLPGKPRVKVPRGPDGSTRLEAEFDLLLAADGLPPAVKEYRFMSDRNYRFDRCYPTALIAFELEGGLYGEPCLCCHQLPAGGHSSVAGILRDINKGNLATELGWRVYRIEPGMIEDGRALLLVEQVLAAAGVIEPRPVNPIIAAQAETASSRRRWKTGRRRKQVDNG